MNYCQRCVIPDTRPGIRIGGDGVCSACAAHDEKKSVIDWTQRRKEFDALLAEVRGHGAGYDCVIPVSGGKDSTWQVVKCLEHGLHPLAVTWKTPARTEIGARNLANLIDLGVDHIDFQINPKVERKFLLQALLRFGSTAVPMHMAMFNIPLTIALKHDIPLVVWGENSADEYGGTGDGARGPRLDSEWLKRWGVTHGTTARDWVSDGLTEQELTPYFGPTDEELAERNVKAVFLGYYFPWDPVTSLEVAQDHGFLARAEGPKTGYYDYADIDDDFISIHHYLKWYKFGITRTYDHLSLEVRNGRMSRDEAVRVLSQIGDETPSEDIARFCEFVGITKPRFFEIIEGFRSPDVWTRRNGRWVIEDFLIPEWEWA